MKDIDLGAPASVGANRMQGPPFSGARFPEAGGPRTLYAERDPMIARGDLYSASLDPVVGSEQGGVRPVLVIQNDVGNRYSPTVIVLAVTGQLGKARLPTHVPVQAGRTGLMKDSVILAEQIRTLDKRRLRERIGAVSPEVMERVSQALKISLGFLN